MKMQAIADQLQPLIPLVPYCQVTCDDNIMSSVWIRASFDARETWSNGIYQNSRHFMIHITPPKGARWYEGGNVTAELTSGYKVHQFRKYTSTPEKVVAKIKQWIESFNR